jgi:DnaK suppressor protein
MFDAFFFQNPLAIRPQSVLQRKFLERTYFPLHGYPIASICSPSVLGTLPKPADSFVERMAKSKAQKKDAPLENGEVDSTDLENQQPPSTGIEDGDEKLPPFLRKQKSKLLQLRDTLLDSMMGVSRDTLRSRAEGSEASAFGMHQADAGSDAYDRDFALSLLSQEQDALYEIEEALKRVDAGTYGVCEMSGKPIPHARLEAIPFARFTVECQTQIEKQKKAMRVRQPVTSLFGLTDEEGGEGEEEDTITDAKD